MKKLRYGMMAVLVMMAWSFALLAETEKPRIAVIEIENPRATYQNGDVLQLTGSNFDANEPIDQAALYFYDADRKLLGAIPVENYQVAVDEAGQLSGSVTLDKIPANVAYTNVLLTARRNFVRGVGFLPVQGSSQYAPFSPQSVQGSLTITDQTGDGVAFPFETINLNGSMSGASISNAAVNEYDDAGGTNQINTTSVSTTNITFSSGTVGGSIQNITSYDATTLKIRVVLISNTFDFALSNTLNAPDTQAPVLISATATSLTNIRVTFDEAVVKVGDPSGRFSLGGSDAGGRTITAVTAVGSSPATQWDLTLSSALSNRNPALTIAYTRVSGSNDQLEDAAGNEVANSSTITVSDQIAPDTPTLVQPAGDAEYTTTVPLEVNADASTSSVQFQGSTDGSNWTTLSLSITNNGGGNFTATYTPGTKYAYYRVIASDPDNNSTNSASSVNLSDAYQIKITSAETPVNVNQTAQIDIAIQNNYGDNVAYFSNFNSVYTLSSDGGGTFTSDDAGNNTITQVTISGGSSTATFYYKQASAGTPTITVTESASNLPVNSDNVQITVNGVNVTGFDLLVNGGSAVTAGTAFSIQLTAKDGANTQTNYTGTHTITITGTATNSPDGTSPTLPSNQSVTFTNGVGTVTGVVLVNSGETPTLTATDESSNSGTSGSITVNDAAAAEVIVKSQADAGDGDYSNNIFTTATYQGATQADPDASVQVFAEVYDQYGNRTTGSTFSWTGTGDFTLTGVISFSNAAASNPTVTFTGTANTVYTGTLSVTVNSAFSDATGTITVDNSPPAQVSGFDAANSNNDEFVAFEWTPGSSGDDGTSGSITSFQIRWASEAAGPIDSESKWNAATVATSGNATVFGIGAANVDMSSFPAGNKYFAIRTFDDVGNKSPITYTTTTDFSLPVTLTSFVATAGYGQVVLKWVTASELNNEGFFVYRATNEAGPYTDLLNQQIIPGRGTTNEATEYEFVDKNVKSGNTYYYKLVSRDFNGTIHESPMRASATVLELPKSFELAQNYPNPFNPTTNFSFTLAQAGTVSLEVYNILGQKIRTIVENEFLEPGVYDGSFQWDAKDDAGNVVSGGIYYYVFTVKENNFRKVRKMVFLK